jgi:hypothetical protein
LTFAYKKRSFSRSRMLELLNSLADTNDNDALSLYLPPSLPASEVKILLKEISMPDDIIAEIEKTVASSQTGAVIFWSVESKYMVLPPFPIPKKNISHSFNVVPLQSALSKDYLIVLVLVRLGSYGIGVYRGEKRVSSKVGTGLVHGRHRQGGSSAHRFERHRDKQIEYFLTRVCQRARENIEPYVKSLDYIVYGGAQTTIRLLKKQCPLLENIEIPTLPPLLDIPEPRQVVLESSIIRVWSSKVFEWRED